MHKRRRRADEGVSSQAEQQAFKGLDNTQAGVILL